MNTETDHPTAPPFVRMTYYLDREGNEFVDVRQGDEPAETFATGKQVPKEMLFEDADGRIGARRP